MKRCGKCGKNTDVINAVLRRNKDQTVHVLPRLCVHILYTNIPDTVSNEELIEAGSGGVISSLLCIGDIKPCY